MKLLQSGDSMRHIHDMRGGACLRGGGSQVMNAARACKRYHASILISIMYLSTLVRSRWLRNFPKMIHGYSKPWQSAGSASPGADASPKMLRKQFWQGRASSRHRWARAECIEKFCWAILRLWPCYLRPFSAGTRQRTW